MMNVVLAVLLMSASVFAQDYEDGDLRLSDGTTEDNGRLEVYLNSVWGTICDDYFGADDATVACRQLGYDIGSARQEFTPVTTLDQPVLLDDVQCVGTEARLTECPSAVTPDCPHNQDTGVVCGSEVLASNDACFSAVDFMTGWTFSPPLDGEIYGIKLVHKSVAGVTGVTCDTKKPYTNWGCFPNSHQWIGVQMVREDQSPKTTYYPSDGQPLSWAGEINCAQGCRYSWYTMDTSLYPYHADTDELLLTDPQSKTVTTDMVFSLQYGEGCCALSTSDNAGTSCAKVYFLYGKAIDIDCQVSDWVYGDCSEPCGGGIYTRTRTVTAEKVYNGADCPALSETSACNIDPCSNAELLSYSADGAIGTNIVGGQLSQPKVDALKAAGGVVIMAWGTDHYPSDIDDYTTYETAIRFTVPDANAITAAQNSGSGRPCGGAYYIPVSVQCIVGVCNMPETMYTGVNFQTVCYGNSYGVVYNMPEDNPNCDWAMDGQAFRALYIRSDDDAGPCHGMKDETNFFRTDSGLDSIGLFAGVGVADVDCVESEWGAYGDCTAICGGTQTRTRTIETPAANDGQLCGALSETIACAECCPNGVGTFDWDDLTQKGLGRPEVSEPVFSVNPNDLSLGIVVEVQYLGETKADNQREPNFGTTYVLDFEDFDAHTDRINEPGTCQNRKAEDFTGSFDAWWGYSSEPQKDGEIGSVSTLAYPPPPSDKWSISMKDNGCDTVIYEGHFTWAELRECQSYANDDSHIYTEIVSDPNWLNLTGIFYINVISPIWYGATDLGYYRVYQLLSQPFVIAVSTSIQVLASTGINLMTMSVIAVYKDDTPISATANKLSQDFKLVMMTEVAEYLKLTRNNNELFEFTDPNSINTNSLVDSNTFDTSNMMENGGDCLQNTPKDSYICSQLWIIKAEDKGCTAGEIGTDFSGSYSVSFTPECRETTNAHCNGAEGEPGWLADHADIARGVTLSTDLTWKDEICDPIIFKVQFEAEMLFYQTVDFTDGSNVDGDSYMYQIGEDKIYVEIRTNFPDPTLTIFNAELVQVHICTFPDGTVPPSDSNDLDNMGCFNSARDSDMDEYFYDIWPIPGVDYVNFEEFTDGYDTSLTNIVRFAFDIPEEVARDRLYVHAQIEVELQELLRRRRVLLDVSSTPTANQMRHFGDQIGVTRKNKPKEPELPIPNPSNMSWFMSIASVVFAIVLMAGICAVCYWKVCKKTVRYHKVGYVDSEFDSEAGMIDHRSSN